MKHGDIYVPIKNALAEQGELLSKSETPQDVLSICSRIRFLNTMLFDWYELERSECAGNPDVIPTKDLVFEPAD